MTHAYLLDFLDEAGIDSAEAITLIRLAATASVEQWDDALMSFSEPSEVQELAWRVARTLYGPTFKGLGRE